MEEEKHTTTPMDTEAEVSLDKADQYEEAQKEKPKVDLTEEEAKVAAENVSKLIDVSNLFNSRRIRWNKKRIRWASSRTL